MAISTNALTMAQAAIMSNAPLVQAVTFSLIDAGSIMARDIPFLDKKTLIANGVRWEGALPTVNWSQINAEGTSTSGTPTPYQEQAFILRNVIDVDKFLVMDSNQISDPRATQLDAYLTAVAYDFNYKFFKNDHVTGDANAIVGLRYRINNGTVYGVRSENKIDAGGADITAAATATTFGAAVEFLDQALWSVGSVDGTDCVIYMDSAVLRRLDRLSRQFAGQGGFSQAQDQIGRTVLKYKNAELRDPGVKADQSTHILTVTEAATGLDASSTFTSMYVVNYGDGKFGGWQMQPLGATDIGLLEAGSTYRTLVDWAGGLISQNNRSIARVFNVKYS
jgi:hypothetical protein